VCRGTSPPPLVLAKEPSGAACQRPRSRRGAGGGVVWARHSEPERARARFVRTTAARPCCGARGAAGRGGRGGVGILATPTARGGRAAGAPRAGAPRAAGTPAGTALRPPGRPPGRARRPRTTYGAPPRPGRAVKPRRPPGRACFARSAPAISTRRTRWLSARLIPASARLDTVAGARAGARACRGAAWRPQGSRSRGFFGAPRRPPPTSHAASTPPRAPHGTRDTPTPHPHTPFKPQAPAPGLPSKDAHASPPRPPSAAMLLTFRD
jgi:hypothetical protein